MGPPNNSGAGAVNMPSSPPDRYADFWERYHRNVFAQETEELRNPLVWR